MRQEMYSTCMKLMKMNSDLRLQPLDLRILIFQLCPQLIGGHLLGLHDLHQMDVLLHENFPLDDEIRVTADDTENNQS